MGGFFVCVCAFKVGIVFIGIAVLVADFVVVLDFVVVVVVIGFLVVVVVVVGFVVVVIGFLVVVVVIVVGFVVVVVGFAVNGGIGTDITTDIKYKQINIMNWVLIALYLMFKKNYLNLNLTVKIRIFNNCSLKKII